MPGSDEQDKKKDPIQYYGESNFPTPYLVGGETASDYEQKNIRVVERVMEEFWFKGKCETAPELFAEECWRYDPFAPDLQGPEAYATMVRKYHKAFKFNEFDLQIVMADREWIAWRAVTKANHIGDFEGIPATGANLNVITHTFVRFNEDHKALEGWAITDYFSLFIDMFFSLNWFQRIWYAPRLYKTMKQIKKNMELPPTNPSQQKTVLGPTS